MQVCQVGFPGGRDSKEYEQETQVQSLGQEDPSEKEMATHFCTLAWKIPWMEEPGGLQSMGLQRVKHDWATSLHLAYKENQGFLGGSVVKNLAANAGDSSWIPGWGRSPRGRNGNLFQYSCLENLRGQRSLVKATIRGVAKSQTQLSTHIHTQRRIAKKHYSLETSILTWEFIFFFKKRHFNSSISNSCFRCNSNNLW